MPPASILNRAFDALRQGEMALLLIETSWDDISPVQRAALLQCALAAGDAQSAWAITVLMPSSRKSFDALNQVALLALTDQPSDQRQEMNKICHDHAPHIDVSALLHQDRAQLLMELNHTASPYNLKPAANMLAAADRWDIISSWIGKSGVTASDVTQAALHACATSTFLSAAKASHPVLISSLITEVVTHGLSVLRSLNGAPIPISLNKNATRSRFPAWPTEEVARVVHELVPLRQPPPRSDPGWERYSLVPAVLAALSCPLIKGQDIAEILLPHTNHDEASCILEKIEPLIPHLPPDFLIRLHAHKDHCILTAETLHSTVASADPARSHKM